MENLTSIIGQGLLTGDGAIQPDFRFAGNNTGMVIDDSKLHVMHVLMHYRCHTAEDFHFVQNFLLKHEIVLKLNFACFFFMCLLSSLAPFFHLFLTLS